jgi:hypothetical protein
LPAIEFLRGHEIFQILVVRPDLKFVLGTLEEMSPFFKGTHHCKHFLVVNLIVPLNLSKALGIKGDRMPFAILWRLLG